MHVLRVFALATLVGIVAAQSDAHFPQAASRAIAGRLVASQADARSGAPVTSYQATLQGALPGAARAVSLSIARGDGGLSLNIDIGTAHGMAAPNARSTDWYTFAISQSDLEQDEHNLVLDTSSDLAPYGRVKARWHFKALLAPPVIVLPNTEACRDYMPFPEEQVVPATASAELHLHLPAAAPVSGSIADKSAEILTEQLVVGGKFSSYSSTSIVLSTRSSGTHVHNPAAVRKVSSGTYLLDVLVSKQVASKMVAVMISAFAGSAASTRRPSDLSITVDLSDYAPVAGNLISTDHEEYDLLTLSNSTFSLDAKLKGSASYHGPAGRLALAFGPGRISTTRRHGNDGTVTDKCTGKIQHKTAQPDVVITEARATVSGTLAPGLRRKQALQLHQCRPERYLPGTVEHIAEQVVVPVCAQPAAIPIYGHPVTQSVKQFVLWNTPPFEPQADDGRVYPRVAGNEAFRDGGR